MARRLLRHPPALQGRLSPALRRQAGAWVGWADAGRQLAIWLAPRACQQPLPVQFGHHSCLPVGGPPCCGNSAVATPPSGSTKTAVGTAGKTVSPAAGQSDCDTRPGEGVRQVSGQHDGTIEAGRLAPATHRSASASEPAAAAALRRHLAAASQLPGCCGGTEHASAWLQTAGCSNRLSLTWYIRDHLAP